jgi:hypothetical protein
MPRKPRKPATPVQTIPAPAGVPSRILAGLANQLADIAPGLWDRPRILAYGPGPLAIERWLRCPDVQPRPAALRDLPPGTLATIVTPDPSPAALQAAAQRAHADGCAALLAIAPCPLLPPLRLRAAGWECDHLAGLAGYRAAVCVPRAKP